MGHSSAFIIWENQSFKGTMWQKCFCVHSVQDRVMWPRKCHVTHEEWEYKDACSYPRCTGGLEATNHEVKHQPVCFQKWTWHRACLSSSLLPFVLEFATKISVAIYLDLTLSSFCSSSAPLGFPSILPTMQEASMNLNEPPTGNSSQPSMERCTCPQVTQHIEEESWHRIWGSTWGTWGNGGVLPNAEHFN